MVWAISRTVKSLMGAPSKSKLSTKTLTYKPSWNSSSYKGLKKIEDSIIRMINALRKTKGLGILVVDPRLRTAARQHTQEMISRKYYSHISPVSAWSTAIRRACHAGFLNPYVTENVNVVSGYADPAAGIYTTWVKSPGHYKNMIDKKMTHTGVGVVKAMSGGQTKYYATQLFAIRPLDFRKITLRQTRKKVLRFQVNLSLSNSVKIEVWRGKQYLGNASRVPGGVQLTIDLPQKRPTTHSFSFAMKYDPKKRPMVCSMVHVNRNDGVYIKYYKHVPICQLITKVTTTTKRQSMTRWSLSGEAKANTTAAQKARFYMNKIWGPTLPLRLGKWARFSHPLSTPRTLFALVIGGLQKKYLYLQPNSTKPFRCP